MRAVVSLILVFAAAFGPGICRCDAAKNTPCCVACAPLPKTDCEGCCCCKVDEGVPASEPSLPFSPCLCSNDRPEALPTIEKTTVDAPIAIDWIAIPTLSDHDQAVVAASTLLVGSSAEDVATFLIDLCHIMRC